jgi:general secretion pathway protein A
VTRSTIPRATRSAATVPEQPAQSGPYPYRDYQRARGLLQAAIGRGTFYALVTGASGAGKTSLKDDLSGVLDQRQQLVYVSASAKATSPSLARFLARVFRVVPKRSYLETVTELMAALKAHTASVILWMDEADQLPHATLSELRGLAESSGQGRPAFSLVLSGLRELSTILDAPDLFPLKRRLDVRCVLEGLRRDEVDGFLLHRFGSAGRARLPEPLHDELFERTQAAPALIHKVATLALDLAGDGHPVREEHLRAALEASL